MTQMYAPMQQQMQYLQAMQKQLLAQQNMQPQQQQQQHDGCGYESDSAQQSRIQFPWKLHEMLECAEKENNEDIVCWLPDGLSFKVRKPEEFMEKIMPRYFNQTKFKSFQRQLYIYGFSKVSKGPSRGAYRHSKFCRHNKAACRHMTPQKVKSLSKTAQQFFDQNTTSQFMNGMYYNNFFTPLCLQQQQQQQQYTMGQSQMAPIQCTVSSQFIANMSSMNNNNNNINSNNNNNNIDSSSSDGMQTGSKMMLNHQFNYSDLLSVPLLDSSAPPSLPYLNNVIAVSNTTDVRDNDSDDDLVDEPLLSFLETDFDALLQGGLGNDYDNNNNNNNVDGDDDDVFTTKTNQHSNQSLNQDQLLASIMEPLPIEDMAGSDLVHKDEICDLIGSMDVSTLSTAANLVGEF